MSNRVEVFDVMGTLENVLITTKDRTKSLRSNEALIKIKDDFIRSIEGLVESRELESLKQVEKQYLRTAEKLNFKDIKYWDRRIDYYSFLLGVYSGIAELVNALSRKLEQISIYQSALQELGINAVKILVILFQQNIGYVRQIARLTNIPVSTVSDCLHKLRELGYVEVMPSKRETFYSLTLKGSDQAHLIEDYEKLTRSVFDRHAKTAMFTTLKSLQKSDSPRVFISDLQENLCMLLDKEEKIKARYLMIGVQDKFLDIVAMMFQACVKIDFQPLDHLDLICGHYSVSQTRDKEGSIFGKVKEIIPTRLDFGTQNFIPTRLDFGTQNFIPTRLDFGTQNFEERMVIAIEDNRT